MKSFFTLSILLSLLLMSCVTTKPIDADANRKTRALYKNLRKLSKEHILFGHQHATEYGHGLIN